jgi:hypothetical protein
VKWIQRGKTGGGRKGKNPFTGTPAKEGIYVTIVRKSEGEE